MEEAALPDGGCRLLMSWNMLGAIGDHSLEVDLDHRRFDKTGSSLRSEDCHTGMTRRWYGHSIQGVGQKPRASRILWNMGSWYLKAGWRMCNKL